VYGDWFTRSIKINSMLDQYFPRDWIDAMGAEQLTQVLTEISAELVELRKVNSILPEVGSPLLFQAFRETPLDLVRVSIVGLDIYHSAGQFNGLAFGNGLLDGPVPKKISPSLLNILKEVERTELVRPNPSLYSWARQGVLMINTAHSVIEGIPSQHLWLWKPFTDLVFKALSTKQDIVWMLWGKDAQAYSEQITNSSHQILKAGHPSPLNTAKPFAGCGCFQDCNVVLKNKGYKSIIWN
jgi:uracil-DNA glycosylase